MNHQTPASAPPPPPLSLPLSAKTSAPLPARTSPHAKPLPASNPPPACVPIPLPSIKPATKPIPGKNVVTPPATTAATTTATRNCESCKKTHDGSYGSGRFCSSNCAKKVGANIKWSHALSSGPRTFKSTKPDGSIDDVVRKRRKQEERKCENCQKMHDGSYGSGRFCSVHCARRVAASRKWEKRRGDKRMLAGLVKRRRMTPSPPPGSLKRSASAPTGNFMDGGFMNGGSYVDYTRIAPYSQCTPLLPASENRVAMQQPQFWAMPPPYAMHAMTPMVPPNAATTPQVPFYYVVPANAAIPPTQGPRAESASMTPVYGAHFHGMTDVAFSQPQLQKVPLMMIGHGMIPVASEPAFPTHRPDSLTRANSDSVVRHKDENDHKEDSSSAAQVLLSLKERKVPDSPSSV